MAGYDIAIIGAGFGGIGMAAKALQAGLRVVVLERADDVGGTWRDNTYPGCACDTQSHHYSFSFAPNPDWTRRYAGQPEILSYLRRTADRLGVSPHIRFGERVTGARWDEATARWQVTTARGAELFARVVVSAVGQLNQPNIPDFPGRESFAGKVLHTAQWDPSYDLSGKEVAVIGNAASGIQLIPQVAKRAKRLTVLQRSPNWLVAKDDRAFSGRERWAFRNLPLVRRIYRWSIYWQWERSWPEFIEGSARARRQTAVNRAHIAAEVCDPALTRALTPDYPLGCRRILLADDYFPALERDNVRLVADRVARFTADGLITRSGEEIKADCVVLATGFRAHDFLPGLDVVGRGGKMLAEEWKAGGGPAAYLGLTVPGFPNFFMLYGPNTNLGHNSIVFMLECQIHYVMQAVRRLRAADGSALEVTPKAAAQQHRRLERELARTAWAGSCTSWYKTETGRIINNWSTSTLRYWWLTRRLRWRDYVLR